uniref:MYND-type domain-containing protein n=1 Tax=Tetradesmus obliquus TaxID=3088 RepID=A0A383WJ46_TETOB|eukprot:jgi/Sobl393_1/2784/SZX76766.1
MQRQQLARAVAQHLQRLQRSINRGNPASQAQALEDLLLSVDGADAAAKLHILQQSGILVTLKQVFDEFTAATAGSNSRAPGLAALLLAMLAGAGQLAVEHITAQPGGAAQLVLQQPGIVAALADLLQPQHSPQAQSAALVVLSDTVGALAADLGTRPAAEQVVQQAARQPGFAENEVRLLSSARHARQARSRAVPLLFFLVRYDSATCRQLLEWPAAIAALASALDSKDSEDRRVAAEALTQMSKGDLWALAASCGTDANTYAAVLEATARKWATEMSGLLPGEAAGGPIGVQLSALATCVAAALLKQQPRALAQRQLLPEQWGLLSTGLKLATAGLGSWIAPAQALLAIVMLCDTLPGAKLVALIRGPQAAAAAAAAAAAHGVPQASRAELGSRSLDCSPSAAAASSSGGGSSSNTAGTSAGAAASRAATGGADMGISLLLGRALHAAGRALLQVHEQPGIIAAPTDSSSSSSTEPWRVEQEYQNLSGVVATTLWGCVTALKPALQEAAAGSATAGSSSSSSHPAALQRSLNDLLQLQQELQTTLGRYVVRPGSSSSSSSSSGSFSEAQAAAAESQLRAQLTANVGRQMVTLGSGVCVQLAAGQHWCCANPGCTSLADASERQLVAGPGTVCSACRSVRLCGPACNKAYWKAGHRQVCALFKQRNNQGQAAEQQQ